VFPPETTADQNNRLEQEGKEITMHLIVHGIESERELDASQLFKVQQVQIHMSKQLRLQRDVHTSCSTK
jgi:hypothetical protein